MFLKEMGVGDVLVIGNKSLQMEKAMALGVAREGCFDIRKGDAGEWLREKVTLNKDRERDIFFEYVGKNESVSLAVQNTVPGGKVMLIGNPASIYDVG